jgi:hypothetical protein
MAGGVVEDGAGVERFDTRDEVSLAAVDGLPPLLAPREGPVRDIGSA